MRIVVCILIAFCCGGMYAQTTTISTDDSTYVLYQLVEDNDTFLVATIDEVYIFPQRKFKNKFEAWRYRRLIRNVKKAYPYAQKAADIFAEVNDSLAFIETEKERKQYLKTVEDELQEEFEGELRKLTISQGRILLKLIDRELGKTSYTLLQEYRGNFSAVFWQTIARIFGNNLKSSFDAEGEDKLIDEICHLIDQGIL